MKKLSIVLASSILFGCASHQMMSVSGVKRVEIKQDKYETPQFYVKNYEPKVASRAIASVNENNDYTYLSVKKLYFLTLWQQQTVFNKILGKENSQNFCPQFHNDLLKYEDRLKGVEHAYHNKQDVTSAKDSPDHVVFYPVLSLPYKGVDLYSYLNQSGSWDKSSDYMKQALSVYAQKNEQEIQELCSKGVTDGLYVYQNLTTYYSDDQNFISSNQALPSILKVKPVSNMLILNSFLRQDYQTNMSGVQTAFLQKLNVSWFKNYLYEMTSMRNNKLSSFALKE